MKRFRVVFYLNIDGISRRQEDEVIAAAWYDAKDKIRSKYNIPEKDIWIPEEIEDLEVTKRKREEEKRKQKEDIKNMKFQQNLKNNSYTRNLSDSYSDDLGDDFDSESYPTKYTYLDYSDPYFAKGYLNGDVFFSIFEYLIIAVCHIIFVLISQFFISNPLQLAYCIEMTYFGFLIGKKIIKPEIGNPFDNGCEYWFPGQKTIILHLYKLRYKISKKEEDKLIASNNLDKFLIIYIYRQGNLAKFFIHIAIIALFSLLGYFFGDFLMSTDFHIRYLFNFYFILAMIPFVFFHKIMSLIWDNKNFYD
ncbi:hypothetical protein HA150_00195 [Prochlorococcus marinus XMU1414]|uniref:Uncharacterized protein n=1 Tax=Prochlorococcus marinus XMU1424 TaxID=2774497 RepID=A0A9D9BW98_PROMR|nr:hypothetical protein [Prochlorococcus marinus]MBO8227318.1 hypothetical protein [Prochlorococcus marinus XMU1414]MBW3046662.1 hypothetical protein [Prochlorococcus marinus str. MU1414]MCR8532902.1 hypothetical protein [Prochlorococcus marinus XMU1420]MCR8536200.1 hypothetical protein [Prochlorococcus marinus XMU1424]